MNFFLLLGEVYLLIGCLIVAGRMLYDWRQWRVLWQWDSFTLSFAAATIFLWLPVLLNAAAERITEHLDG